MLFSGGDDLKLKGWDVRQGFDHPTFVNKRSVTQTHVTPLPCCAHAGDDRFDGGVTSMQSHPYLEHMVAVGR
jgi:diphthamide biosynthesis protein 7